MITYDSVNSVELTSDIFLIVQDANIGAVGYVLG